MWDAGGVNQALVNVTDSFASLTDPHFRITPGGYYDVTGGFYLDDLYARFVIVENEYVLLESWDDGDWVCNPAWFEYDNENENFAINSSWGHDALPALEGWGGNTGTDYTALYTPFVANPSLSVVGPGYGGEWRVGQYGAVAEWNAVDLRGCVRVDLYRQGSFFMNIRRVRRCGTGHCKLECAMRCSAGK